MRRTDRAIEGTDDILAVLDGCEIIRIGLSADDRPYIVPMNFAYETVDGKIFIYLHCAREGRKLDMIARNSSVCFEADRSYRTVKADTACRWTAEFRSVMGEGIVNAVTDDAERVRAMDMLMHRYGFEGIPQYTAQALAAVTVLRISVSSMTGKQHLVKA
ncbi:MAG: pyridoxamine 5'-phosphate oxidase family protein [Methanomassiliicoccaceae archaeon]|jgi:nitroimidazol reductase NimA-like FMN-containing flavoprotein (pyridoxamine 5'-phosphate oxidase superfamily)|nr:pyridoxamine 5'-phosphate oxidase family protein [Methanomassiliicoccaceae archaeon]